MIYELARFNSRQYFLARPRRFVSRISPVEAVRYTEQTNSGKKKSRKSKKVHPLSMAIAGCLAGGGAALYWLSGNTEFYWSTYQSLPSIGFNGIPVALLAVSNPIGVIFTAIFMAMLDIVGQQLTGLTAYNEYITDVIISVIVYLSAFSLVIRMLITGKRRAGASNANAEPPRNDPKNTEEGGEQA